MSSSRESKSESPIFSIDYNQAKAMRAVINNPKRLMRALVMAVKMDMDLSYPLYRFIVTHIKSLIPHISMLSKIQLVGNKYRSFLENNMPEKLIKKLAFDHCSEAKRIKLLKTKQKKMQEKLEKLKALEASLRRAADYCNLQELKDCIEKATKEKIAVNLNTIRNDRGETLLMLASSGHSRDIPEAASSETVKYLLEQKVDVFEKSNDGRTALMEAACYGRTAVAKLLIHSLPIDRRIEFINTKDGGTPGKAFDARAYARTNEKSDFIAFLNDEVSRVTLILKQLNEQQQQQQQQQPVAIPEAALGIQRMEI